MHGDWGIQTTDGFGSKPFPSKAGCLSPSLCIIRINACPISGGEIP